jgi:hypothetical protein
MPSELPEFRDWSVAAVRLLQGVIEADDARLWSVLLSNRSQLESYFARVGVLLVIDESEGLAYLRQLTAEESPAGYDSLPKLFRSTRLSYGQTVLCVLLRDVLRRFEEEETLDERCVIPESDLLDHWKSFFSQHGDDVKLSRELHANLRKLEDLGFVKKFGQAPNGWEARRILKARLNAEELEHLHRNLVAALTRDDQPATANMTEDYE